jgi:hypothetical protein
METLKRFDRVGFRVVQRDALGMDALQTREVSAHDHATKVALASPITAHGFDGRVGRDEGPEFAIGEAGHERVAAISNEVVLVLAGEFVDGDRVEVAHEGYPSKVGEVEIRVRVWLGNRVVAGGDRRGREDREQKQGDQGEAGETRRPGPGRGKQLSHRAGRLNGEKLDSDGQGGGQGDGVNSRKEEEEAGCRQSEVEVDWLA